MTVSLGIMSHAHNLVLRRQRQVYEDKYKASLILIHSKFQDSLADLGFPLLWWPETTWRRKGLFLTTLRTPSSPRELKAGTWMQELKQKLWKIVFTGLLTSACFLCNSDHTLWGSTTPEPTHVHQDNVLQSSYGHLDGGIFSADNVSMCQVDRKLFSHKEAKIRGSSQVQSQPEAA